MTVQREALRRQLGLFSLFTLAFGTIIGIGWITVMGSWLSQAGSMGAILGFLGGGLVMVIIGLCYAEMAGMYPVSGGEVAYIYEMYGARFSFAAGWFLAFDYIAVTSFEAISVGWVIGVLWPETQGQVIYSILGQDVYLGSLLLGLVIMGIITWINYRGAKSTAFFQNVMTIALVIVSLAFIIVGIGWGEPANLEPYLVVEKRNWIFGVLAVFATTPFWFAGFDIIPQAMGEVETGTRLRLLPRVITLAILVALLFYCLVILTAAMSLPRAEFLEFELPVAGAMEAAFASPLLGKVVLFAGLCGLITSWNAIFFGATRLVFALSRAHMIPHAIAAIHDRHGSPFRAVLFVGLIGAVGALFGRNAIGTIVNAASTCLALVFLMVVIGIIRLRRSRPDHVRPFKVPGKNLLPITAAVFSFAMLILSLYEPYRAADGSMPPEWIILIVWGLLGAVFWMLAAPLRRKVSEEDRRRIILDE